MGSWFGPIIGGEQLEVAVKDTLKLWLPTYLAEIERQRGLDPRSLPMIRNFTFANELEKFPEDQLPVAVIISPGIGGDLPTMDGEGQYTAKFICGIAVIVSADTQTNTNRLSKMYGAAIRACLLQQPSLGGFASGVEWQDERFDDIPSEDRRSLAAAQEIFHMEVSGITNERLGMAVPPDDPYAVPAEWPEAETVQVSIDKEEPWLT